MGDETAARTVILRRELRIRPPGADCQGWMKEAGFRETRVEHLAGPDSMVIGVR